MSTGVYYVYYNETTVMFIVNERVYSVYSDNDIN